MSLTVLLAQVKTTDVEEKGIFNLIWNADPIIQLTFLLLIFFSVMSWAIILFKYNQVRSAQKGSEKFWQIFSAADSYQKVLDSPRPRSGPLFELFTSAIEMIPKLKNSKNPRALQREQMMHRLTQTREEEIFKLEEYTSFLATTASTAPFVGLFGTVWGILTAFWSIGKAGSSSLATVGPYISEALIATAVGLAAAIPAVVAYNYFARRIKVLVKMMDLFLNDLVLKLQEDSTL